MDTGHDVVIVGVGAAGCGLADRPSAPLTCSLVLIAAGRDLPHGAEPADVRDIDILPLQHVRHTVRRDALRAAVRQRVRVSLRSGARHVRRIICGLGHASRHARRIRRTGNRRGDGVAFGYLDVLVRARCSLSVVTGAATVVLFGDHLTVGVRVDTVKAVRDIAGRGFAVCTGAVCLPALLMRSGIGPATDLAALGIGVCRLPGVGRNLQNYPLLFVAARLRRGARPPESISPHPMTCFRSFSRRPGAPDGDMVLASHGRSSRTALGAQIANFNTPSSNRSRAARCRSMTRGNINLPTAMLAENAPRTWLQHAAGARRHAIVTGPDGADAE